MTILITYASKHGATQKIAEHIKEKFQRLGKDAEVQRVDAATASGDYEAFVIGSAIYYGSWLKEATEWVRHNQDILAKRPVWLFSSGPLGTEVKDSEPQPKEMIEFQATINFQDQQTFFGVLDLSHLSFAERMVAKAVRAPKGDFRNWDAIDSWTESIAQELRVHSL